jgi:hypothetical protein
MRNRGQTKLLERRDIAFTDSKHQKIRHDDQNLPAKAAFISITFRDQKNRKKMTTHTHVKATDPLLCPVKAWALMVQRILHTKPAEQTMVNYFRDNTKPTGQQHHHFTQHNTIATLRQSVIDFPHHYPYKAEDIRIHSLQSGAAVALYLNNVDHAPRAMEY